MAEMTNDEVAEGVARLPWFQRFEIRGGIWTPGFHDIPRHLDLIKLPERLDGLSVIDLGACNGALTIEAWRRGAAQVIAADHPRDWGMAGHGVSHRETFDFAMKATGCPADAIEFDFDREGGWPSRYLTFDVVLALGVAYHLKAPFPFFERCHAITKPGGLLIVETHLADLPEHKPLCEFYPGTEFNGDKTNWWGFNASCVLGMLTAAGFVDVEEVGRYPYGHIPGWRAAFHARRASQP